MTEPPAPLEAEFATESVVAVDETAIARIRQAAHASPRRRARFCLHMGPDASMHNMLIVLLHGTVVPVHRHHDKPECYHMVSGLATLRLFNDAGQPVRHIALGAPGSGREFLCRIAAGQWHRVEVESDEVVLLESTSGPFRPEDTEYQAATPL